MLSLDLLYKSMSSLINLYYYFNINCKQFHQNYNLVSRGGGRELSVEHLNSHIE